MTQVGEGDEIVVGVGWGVEKECYLAGAHGYCWYS